MKVDLSFREIAFLTGVLNSINADAQVRSRMYGGDNRFAKNLHEKLTEIGQKHIKDEEVKDG